MQRRGSQLGTHSTTRGSPAGIVHHGVLTGVLTGYSRGTQGVLTGVLTGVLQWGTHRYAVSLTALFMMLRLLKARRLGGGTRQSMLSGVQVPIPLRRDPT